MHKKIENKFASQQMKVCFSKNETIHHALFVCHALSEGTISLKCFCSFDKIPNTYTAILNSNLCWDIDHKIFKASVDILKKRNIF